MPRSCALPAPDALPVEPDEVEPLETEPEPEGPLLLELPLGRLVPELVVPEPDAPGALLPLGLVLPELIVPDDPVLLPLGEVLPLDVEPEPDVLLPLDTDPLVEPEGLVLLMAPPVEPPDERLPGAALALEDDCASLLQASKSACAGLLLCANAPFATATTVAAVKIAVAVLKHFMVPPP